MPWWQLLGYIGAFEYDAWHLWNPHPIFLGYRLVYQFGQKHYGEMKWLRVPQYW